MAIVTRAVLIVLILAGVPAVSHACPAQTTVELEHCVTALVSELSDSDDVNEIFCSESHRKKLGCVIERLHQCPDSLGESFMTEFQHGDFKAAELLTVTSADIFCDKCVPALHCLKQVDFENGFMVAHNRSLWKQINPKYVCGDHKSDIECVARGLPECTRYLQYKKKSFTDDDAMAVQNTPRFIADQCHRIALELQQATECTTDTSLVLQKCSEMAEDYREESKQVCGVRHCIAMEMEQCQPDWVEMFVESINAYRNEKIPMKPCPASGTVTIATSVFTVLLALLISISF